MTGKAQVLRGKVVILHDEFQSGFVNVRGTGNVFFVPKTNLKNTSYKKLKIGDRVKIESIDTRRGPVARSLELLALPRHANKKSELQQLKL